MPRTRISACFLSREMVQPLLPLLDMRISVMGLLLVAGCMTERTDTPGRAELSASPEGLWIQGDRNHVRGRWEYACEEGGEWFCTSSTVTLLDVSCNGCTVFDDPRGRSGKFVTFDAVATTDDHIEIAAQLQLDPTGDITTVKASLTGDHEVAIEARCRLIDTATLTEHAPGDRLPEELFRSCDTPRRENDTVVIFPALRTFHGYARFPFCVTPDLCGGGYGGDDIRPLSTFSITPEPTGWRRALPILQLEPALYAIIPAMPSGGTVSLSAALAPTGTSTISVEIPPVQSPAPL